jgi:hypothetical protein
MDSSGLDETFNVYNPKYVKEVIISFAFFALFFVAQSIDFYGVLVDFGVTETAISKAKLIYVYLFGYCLFLIKFFLAFLFFIILILIVVILFTSFYSIIMIDTKKELKNAVSYADMMEEKQNMILEKIKEACIWMGRYLTAFLSLKQFVLIYVAMIPIFLLFVYLFYAMILYKQKEINEDEEHKSKIMTTNHGYLFYLFISMVVMGFLYLVYIYIVEINKE